MSVGHSSPSTYVSVAHQTALGREVVLLGGILTPATCVVSIANDDKYLTFAESAPAVVTVVSLSRININVRQSLYQYHRALAAGPSVEQLCAHLGVLVRARSGLGNLK